MELEPKPKTKMLQNVEYPILKRAGWLSPLRLPELPVKIVKSIEAVKTTVNERIELECEVSEEGAQVKWYL